ncbi:cobalamin-binding protein [Allostella vacuolata]|nr:cobalamin-binding protein [Stella vacuolata]
MRPPRARREKPRVSAFTSADFPRILALEPDLVLAFSDLQADIAAELVRRGVAVHVFNQRSVAGILDMVRMVGAMVGACDRAGALADRLAAGLAPSPASVRPRVYFEEWDEPMISAIGWVSELIAIAGGIDVFADRAAGRSARDRLVTADEVAARAPDIIIGSWCGRKFQPARVEARAGFADIPAVRNGRLHEIKSALILQPGPAALTDGLAALRSIIGAG